MVGERIFSRLRGYLARGPTPDARPIGGDGPRGFVGGLWHEMGELQFKFLVEHGLRPEHVLLDIACGCLRLGNRIIPYLDPGNYLGIDIDGDLIEHGKTVELGPELYALKRPELVVSGSFEFDKFSKPADVAMAQSLFSHLARADIALCMAKLARRRMSTTVLYATFLESDTVVDNPTLSHPHKAFRYTRDELEQIGEGTGWKMEYIGDWRHPRGQKMLRFSAM
jgi:hypothetical protein